MLRRTSAEVELLVRCVPPSGEITAVDRVRTLLADDLDWELVLELGQRHGVIPLLNRTLGQRADNEHAKAVPDSVRSRLSERARSTALHNAHVTAELGAILDSFEDHGIRALPFKGPVLAAVAYGDVGLREFGDLDLLVPPEDVTRAVDILEARGYAWEAVPRLDDSALLGGPFTRVLVPEYELQREHFTVEVRWRVGDPDRPFSPDVETLWTHRETTEVAGRDVAVLSSEERLLVLAFHGTKHNWHLLKWVCDFVAAMEQTDVHWPRLLRRARRHRVERKLLVGVALADALFDVTPPESVRDRLEADERAIPLAEQVVEAFDSGVPSRPTLTERIVFNVWASDSTGDRLRAVLYDSRFHPGIAEYELLPLRGPLHPLYYLLFPARLLTTSLPHLTRRLGDRSQSLR